MKILLYHKNLCHAEQNILDRAAKKQHLLKKTIFWDIFLFLLTSIGGTLLFLFSPVLMRIPAICAFVPVRNSVWEVLKILFIPACFTGIFRYLWTGDLQKGILTTYAESTALTLGLFMTLHYLCMGILGKEYFKADMLISYLCVIFLTVYLRSRADRQKKSSLSGFLFFVLMTGCFIYFTFNPPAIGLFQEINLLPQ